MSGRSIRTLPLALLWVIVFILALSMNPPSFAALLIRIRNGESIATITRGTDPHNHRYLTYEYVVDGRKFSGVGYGPNHTELGVGKQVKVVYFPAQPRYATLATEREQTRYLEQAMFAGIMMATFATLVVYLTYFRRKAAHLM